MTKSVASGYLAAIIDGEGCVSDPDATRPARSISISLKDVEIMVAVIEACHTLGIAYRVNEDAAEMYRLSITGLQNLKKAAKTPIVSFKKRTRLERNISEFPSRLKTECKKGHKFTRANTYIRVRPNGTRHRVCRMCRDARMREYGATRNAEQSLKKRR